MCLATVVLSIPTHFINLIASWELEGAWENNGYLFSLDSGLGFSLTDIYMMTLATTAHPALPWDIFRTPYDMNSFCWDTELPSSPCLLSLSLNVTAFLLSQWTHQLCSILLVFSPARIQGTPEKMPPRDSIGIGGIATLWSCTPHFQGSEKLMPELSNGELV